MSLYVLARRLGNPWGGWRYSAAEVLGIYFWAVVHDRPTNWAVDPNEWPDDLRPEWLPSQSSMSRRLRKPETVELMTAVEQHLVALLVLGRYLVHIVDGKALAVSAVSKDSDTGYGRGAGAHQKGYKLHAIWSGGPIPAAWALAPMNASEKTMARHLIPTLVGGGYLLGDIGVNLQAACDPLSCCKPNSAVRSTISATQLNAASAPSHASAED
jgi:hypothetical protein